MTTTNTTKKTLVKNTAPKGLVIPEELAGDWGAEEVTSDDVIIPKLLLMHGQSELVQDDKASQGEIIRSTDHVKLAPKGGTVEVIPFMMYKTWINKEFEDGRYVWRGEEPLTPANSDLPWEYTGEGGSQWRRDRAYNYYALVVKDLAEGRFQLPIRLQFQRTSHKAGKQIANWFSECKMEKKPPALKHWNIGAELIKGEKHNYFIFKVDMGGDTTMEELQTCHKWYMEVSKNRENYKDHNVQEEATVEATETDEF